MKEEEEKEEEEEREEEEEEAVESVESDTACSLWEQKTKTKFREILIRINRLFLVGSTV